jgi:hypothetical protein
MTVQCSLRAINLITPRYLSVLTLLEPSARKTCHYRYGTGPTTNQRDLLSGPTRVAPGRIQFGSWPRGTETHVARHIHMQTDVQYIPFFDFQGCGL